MEGEAQVGEQPFVLRLTSRLQAPVGAGHLRLEHIPVDAVEVIHVDAVHVELLQLLVEHTPPLVPVGGAVGVLRGEGDLVTPALQRLADHHLALILIVEVGRVDVVDPQLEGAMDDLDRLVNLDVAVFLRQPHGAEAQCGYLQSRRSEITILHMLCFPPERL